MQGRWFAELEARQKLAPGVGEETEAQRGPELVQGAEIHTQLSLTPMCFPRSSTLRGAGWALWGSWTDSSLSTHFTERKTEAQGRDVSGGGEKDHYDVVLRQKPGCFSAPPQSGHCGLLGQGSPKECVMNK